MIFVIIDMILRNLKVAWTSYPPQLTIQLAGHIEDDEYMAFGTSGEQVSDDSNDE